MFFAMQGWYACIVIGDCDFGISSLEIRFLLIRAYNSISFLLKFNKYIYFMLEKIFTELKY